MSENAREQFENITRHASVLQLMGSMQIICCLRILTIEFSVTAAKGRVLAVTKILGFESTCQSCQGSCNSKCHSSVHRSRTSHRRRSCRQWHGPHKTNEGLNRRCKADGTSARENFDFPDDRPEPKGFVRRSKIRWRLDFCPAACLFVILLKDVQACFDSFLHIYAIRFDGK